MHAHRHAHTISILSLHTMDNSCNPAITSSILLLVQVIDVSHTYHYEVQQTFQQCLLLSVVQEYHAVRKQQYTHCDTDITDIPEIVSAVHQVQQYPHHQIRHHQL